MKDLINVYKMTLAETVQKLTYELINTLFIYTRDDKSFKLSHEQFLSLIKIVNNRLSNDIIQQMFNINNGLPFNLSFDYYMDLNTSVSIDEDNSDLVVRNLESIRKFVYRISGATLTGNLHDKNTKLIFFSITIDLNPSFINVISSLDDIHELRNNIAFKYSNNYNDKSIVDVEGVYLINSSIEFPDKVKQYPLYLIKCFNGFKLYKDEGYSIYVPYHLKENNHTLINLTNIVDNTKLILNKKIYYGLKYPPSVGFNVKLKTDSNITLYNYSKENENYYGENEIPYDINEIEYNNTIDIIVGSNFSELMKFMESINGLKLFPSISYTDEIMNIVWNDLTRATSIINNLFNKGTIIERYNPAGLSILNNCCKINFSMKSFNL